MKHKVKKLIGLSFIDRNTAAYFDSFRIEYIPQEELNKIKDKSITHSRFRIQSDHSINCGICCFYRIYD